MAVVKHSSIEDNPNDDSIETDIPKVYLKVQTLIEFDTFVATHGPFTSIDARKRKGGIKPESATRRSKQPAYFIAELAHVVAMCDERLPFVTLASELTKRNVFHQGLQVEANATGLVLKLIQLPPPTKEIGQSPAWHALLKRLLSASIRVLIKGVLKSWMVEFVFYSTPLSSTHPKEQGSRRPIYFQYEMATVDNTSKTVDSLLNDWSQIVHLYTIVHDMSDYLKIDKYSFLANMFCIKSYNYSKLVLCYGPDKGAMVSISWNNTSKAFRLAFGAANNALNAHSLIQEQLESYLNEYRNLAQVVQLLNETYEPLLSISKLPANLQLGIQNNRPQVPVQTFTIMPQSCMLIRLAYQGMYCLELRIRGSGLVSLRDGAYSRFDRSNVVNVFSPTQGLKAFLSKYVDETAVFRRRSQSEDDNPPSPMEVEGSGFLGHHRGPQSPAGQREPGLRFQHPLTPPSGSNPHTPASPHTSNINQPTTHSGFGSSPATSFNLASPTSLSTNINPSPMPHPSPGGLVANSPLNPQLASPGGLLSNSSPGPQSTNLPGHSPVSSFIPTGHTDGSPFPSQSMSSPAASNWPGSPGIPRPSPARPGQSPLGHNIMHSPQQSDLKIGSHLSRVLPQRSWAGAVPTLLTHEALEMLCCLTPHPQGYPGPDLSPLERFLAPACHCLSDLGGSPLVPLLGRFLGCSWHIGPAIFGRRLGFPNRRACGTFQGALATAIGSSVVATTMNGGPAIVAPPFVCTGSASIFCDKLTLKITFRPAIGFGKIPQTRPGRLSSNNSRLINIFYFSSCNGDLSNREGQMLQLAAIPTTEPGVIHFKVAETQLQCRIILNAQHLQSLHLKIIPPPEQKDLWSQEELQILEKFFDTKAAAPPYKPTSMFTFCNMLNVPANVLKDFIQIMKLELMPGLAQSQGMKWSVQWMLRVSPSAPNIVPGWNEWNSGNSGKGVVLFTHHQNRHPIPTEHGATLDCTTVDLRHRSECYSTGGKAGNGTIPAMAAASQLLKHLSPFQSNMSECSVFPAIRELLLNLTLPSEPQQPSPVSGGVPQIQSPAMQMPGAAGQQGYPGMPMGMMGPQ
ncbi:hypothetical protein NQ317_018789 [Molorchus minor]|uniref:Mediator of RNA polymerase II transcription subunit 14 n=1 Tax=Molorchus minor TaxID=1323400 RepID=A0ABQ9J567_9CUCU|nr:hypothetical protein NQ317_018789 [Molorchus minor]